MNEISKLWFDSYKIGPSFMLLFLFYFVRAPKIADQKYQCINNNYLKIVWLILTKSWLIFDKIFTQMVLYGVFQRIIEINLGFFTRKLTKITFQFRKIVFTHCLIYLWVFLTSVMRKRT